MVQTTLWSVVRGCIRLPAVKTIVIHVSGESQRNACFGCRHDTEAEKASGIGDSPALSVIQSRGVPQVHLAPRGLGCVGQSKSNPIQPNQIEMRANIYRYIRTLHASLQFQENTHGRVLTLINRHLNTSTRRVLSRADCTRAHVPTSVAPLEH